VKCIFSVINQSTLVKGIKISIFLNEKKNH